MKQYITTTLLFFAIAGNLLLDVSFIQLARDVLQRRGASLASRRQEYLPPSIDTYSLIGEDFPRNLPVLNRPAKLLVEESVHYSLTDPEAADDWLWTAPLGDNHIRLGKQYRMFAVAHFHQQHCLRQMRERLVVPFQRSTSEHLHHCLNYLRQWVLCSADVTLEPGQFTERNFTSQRTGASHTCLDWTPVYEMMDDKWLKWAAYRDSLKNNTTISSE